MTSILKTFILGGIVLAQCICAHSQKVSNLSFAKKAETLENAGIKYTSGYVSIPYPNGDVPANTGVCTDVVVRAFRLINVDLQKEVHEDMAAHFDAYPNNWGMADTDANIDHRRVPNLMTYFERKGWSVPITQNETDYLPGDVVAWNLGRGLTHIGIVTSQKASDSRNLIIHNIGAGQVLEDVLFEYTIIGHYRNQ